MRVFDTLCIDIVKSAASSIKQEFEQISTSLGEIYGSITELQNRGQNTSEYIQIERAHRNLVERAEDGAKKSEFYLHKLTHLANTVGYMEQVTKLIRLGERTIQEFDTTYHDSRHAQKAHDSLSQCLRHFENEEKTVHALEKSSHETAEAVNKLDMYMNDPDKCTWFDKTKQTIEKYRQMKELLSIKLGDLAKILPKLISEENNKKNCDELLSQVILLIRELSPIESQQKYELQTPHQENSDLLQKSLDNQQVLVSQFTSDIEPKFRNLAERVDQFLATTGDQFPRLQSTFEQLNIQWQMVWRLTLTTINKLKALLVVCGHLKLTRGILDSYRDKVNTLRFATIQSEEDLTKQIQALKDVLASCESQEHHFTELQASLDSLRSSLDQTNSNSNSSDYFSNSLKHREHDSVEEFFKNVSTDDRDVSGYSRVVDDILNRWRDIKSSLERNYTQLADRRDFNQRLRQERELSEVENVLKRWIGQVDNLKNMIDQRSNDPSPCNEQEIQIQQRENESIGDRLKNIYPQIDQVLSDAKNFVRHNPDNKNVDGLIDQLTEKTSKLKDSWAEYEKKLKILAVLLNAIKSATITVRRYEEELCAVTHIPQQIPAMKSIINHLENLKNELPQQEPTFSNMDVELKVASNTLSSESLEAYSNEIKTIHNRWQTVKQELANKLACFYDQLSFLEWFSRDLNNHNNFIQVTEEKIQDPGLRDIEKTSNGVQHQIRIHVETLTELKNQSNNLENLNVKLQQKKTSWQQYKSDHSALCRKIGLPEKRSFEREDVIEIEISRIRKRYDSLGRLISERIDILKINLEKIRSKEVSI